MKDIKATVIITTYNQKEILSCCLKWLKGISEIKNIIIVDNGSKDGTSEILSQMEYDYIYFDEGIQGYGTVWNAALSNFETEDTIVFMRPQFLPGKKCIRLLGELLEQENCGIAAPMSNGFVYLQETEIHSLEHLLELENQQEGQLSAFRAMCIEKGFWVLSKKAWQENGNFSEKLAAPINVLTDYELALLQKGFLPMVCRQALAYNMVNQTTSDIADALIGGTDREVLKEKWNMKYFNMIPSVFIAGFITDEKEAPLRVLEVGCDLGVTLLEIKNRYPNSQICGLELNKASVEIAKHLAEVKMGNIEDMELPFEGKFDYIIFGDVLEHLHDPQGVLRFCKEKLNQNGAIIASIPNIMHISVMQQLLQGRFQYEDTGLLDRTHIHFFTYYEIIQMFEAEGYEVEEATYTMVDITEEQEELMHKLLEISENIEPFMYKTFQYMVKAKKREESKKINIHGAQNVIDAALDCGVEKVAADE